MEIQIASRMNDFEEGIFQLLNEKIKEYQARGKNVYNLSVGTPDFPPSQEIINAVVKASADPINYKYSLGDLEELVQAFIMHYKERYGVLLEEKELMTVYGSQEGLAHICLSLCDENDVVLVPNPGYPIFEIGPSLANVTLVPYELEKENHYLPDLEKMDLDILKRTRVMIVSYPLNPVAKAANDNFYIELIQWAKKNNIIIIHDNAYSDIIFDGKEGKSILSFDDSFDCCVEFFSLSKSYNYTGARVGFLAGNSKIVQNFKKLRSQIDYGTFLPVQYGAIAALTQDQAGIKRQCQIYQNRRDVLCNGLREIGWPIEDSEGTMFAWAKIPEGFTDDVEVVLELLDKTGVVCTPGRSFGSLGKGHVRFALTLDTDELKMAISAIKNSGFLYKM